MGLLDYIQGKYDNYKQSEMPLAYLLRGDYQGFPKAYKDNAINSSYNLLTDTLSGENLPITGGLLDKINIIKNPKIPQSLYHGTNEVFDKFDKSQTLGGLYFTDSLDAAKYYGNDVIDANILMNNPYVATSEKISSGLLEDLKILKSNLKEKLGLKSDNLYQSNASQIEKSTEDMLKRQGYDSIIIPKDVGSFGENVYIPFDESQINIIKRIQK